VDAQSVKAADTVGTDSRGYDGGKKVNGRKRHVVVDTLGLLVVVLVTAASLQDRDGGRLVLDRAWMKMASIALVSADGGCAGRYVEFARRVLRISLEIVKKPEDQHTFEGHCCIKRSLPAGTARSSVRRAKSPLTALGSISRT
jgi:hypothetical protein